MKLSDVVSNTSPLIFLEKVNSLHLLDDCMIFQPDEQQLKKGLPPLGVLGILKLAFKFERLARDEVKFKVADLTTKHGLFISPDIIDQYLKSFSQDCRPIKSYNAVFAPKNVKIAPLSKVVSNAYVLISYDQLGPTPDDHFLQLAWPYPRRTHLITH